MKRNGNPNLCGAVHQTEQAEDEGEEVHPSFPGNERSIKRVVEEGQGVVLHLGEGEKQQEHPGQAYAGKFKGRTEHGPFGDTALQVLTVTT